MSKASCQLCLRWGEIAPVGTLPHEVENDRWMRCGIDGLFSNADFKCSGFVRGRHARRDALAWDIEQLLAEKERAA